MDEKKFTLELSEFELVVVLAGLGNLAVTIGSKARLTPEASDEVSKLVMRVNDTCVKPHNDGDIEAFDNETADITNRLVKEFALRLLARHEGGAG